MDVVLFGSVVAVCVLSGLVSLSSVSPVAVAIVALVAVMASVPVQSSSCRGEEMVTRCI